jgi:hypothetical protein
MSGLYKLQNGKLITPPKIWRGVVGYHNNLSLLARDGWKPVIETGKGSLYKFIDKKDYIEKSYYEEVINYKTARENAYNASGITVGNVIDALLKAYEGDDAELKTIITQRQIIKKNIKKA